MNEQLVEALRALNLKPGDLRMVQVDGDILVINKPAAEDEPSVYTGHVMLEPWFESPDPAGGPLKLSRGEWPPPDPPVMPVDYDGSEDTA